jgi:hypothetical protein
MRENTKSIEYIYERKEYMTINVLMFVWVIYKTDTKSSF